MAGSSSTYSGAGRTGRGERGADRVESLLDLGPQRDGILGRLELAPIRRLDPTFERQRSPLARWPRVAEVEPGVVAVTRAGDSVHLAHQHRDPRDRRLV